MPKFVGTDLDAKRIEDNASRTSTPKRVCLSFNQIRLLPAKQRIKSLDTTDRGSKGSYAKRWFRWFAAPHHVLACKRSTPKMRAKAERAIRAV